MTLSQSEKVEVLSRITKLQEDTSAVTVQIGHVGAHDIVKSNSVFIKDAPAKIINSLRDDGYSLSMVEGKGVRIYDRR